MKKMVEFKVPVIQPYEIQICKDGTWYTVMTYRRIEDINIDKIKKSYPAFRIYDSFELKELLNINGGANEKDC